MRKTISDILGCASPTNTREPDDFYVTPPECAEALIAADDDRLTLRVWDPCWGTGDISTVLQRHGREVVPTDLIDRGYGQGGVDFLLHRTALARAIVTGPAWLGRSIFPPPLYYPVGFVGFVSAVRVPALRRTAHHCCTRCLGYVSNVSVFAGGGKFTR
jgi:hypothetical protein